MPFTPKYFIQQTSQRFLKVAVEGISATRASILFNDSMIRSEKVVFLWTRWNERKEPLEPAVRMLSVIFCLFHNLMTYGSTKLDHNICAMLQKKINQHTTPIQLTAIMWGIFLDLRFNFLEAVIMAIEASAREIFVSFKTYMRLTLICE